MLYTPVYNQTSDLFFDWKNPRLSEFGIKKTTPDKEIFNLLWEQMAIEELVISMVAHGFFQTEPLIITVEQGKKVVVEGNRRLTAVKVILDPTTVKSKIRPDVLARITPELQKSLKELPVLEVENREKAWRYIGFKHINGAAKWNSFAKAKYIAQIHQEFQIPLSEIAFQVGDTHNTVQKLFQGVMVIDQSERLKIFNKEDIKNDRLYFSHLYTALQYEGFKEYLKITDANSETTEPVPTEKKEELGEVLTWLYGSKSKKIEPVIKSQNPDLRKLESIVRKKDAIMALRDSNNLDYAFELSKPTLAIFEESLYSAQRNLQKAWSYVNTGFSGQEEYLKTAGSIANLADELYNKMDEIITAKLGKGKPKRITED